MKKHQFITVAIPVCLLGMFISCNPKPKSAGTTDPELSIKAMRIENTDSTAVYNVRIFPKKEIMEANKSLAQNMMYQVDSCFYLMKGQKKIYPESAEYIAGGLANSFEYLIIFNTAHDNKLFYQDKYINQKNYQLLLK